MGELDSAILVGLASEFKTYSEATDHNKKPRYLVELLSLLGAVTSKGKDEAMKCTSLVDSLKEVRGHIPSNRKFREVKSQFNRTCVPLNIPAISANVNNQGNIPKKSLPNGTSEPIEANIEKGGDKANGEEDGSGESSNPTNNKKKKNKKSKSKEAQQKRKEQKMNEFQRQAEDEGIPSFAGLVLNSNLNFVTTEEDAAAKMANGSDDDGGAKKAKKKKDKKRKLSEGQSEGPSAEEKEGKPADEEADGSPKKKKSKKKKSGGTQ